MLRSSFSNSYRVVFFILKAFSFMLFLKFLLIKILVSFIDYNSVFFIFVTNINFFTCLLRFGIFPPLLVLVRLSRCFLSYINILFHAFLWFNPFPLPHLCNLFFSLFLLFHFPFLYLFKMFLEKIFLLYLIFTSLFHIFYFYQFLGLLSCPP